MEVKTSSDISLESTSYLLPKIHVLGWVSTKVVKRIVTFEIFNF